MQSLLLETLYDGVLQATTEDRKALSEQQATVYKALSEIDPNKAQQLLKRLKQQSSTLDTEIDTFDAEAKRHPCPPLLQRPTQNGWPPQTSKST